MCVHLCRYVLVCMCVCLCACAPVCVRAWVYVCAPVCVCGFFFFIKKGSPCPLQRKTFAVEEPYTVKVSGKEYKLFPECI